MKTLDELLAYKIKKAKEKYYAELKSIRKNITKEYMVKVLEERVKKQLPGCSTNANTIYMSIHLNSDHNISKDFMLFLENNEDYIQTLGKGTEYSFTHDTTSYSYDYIWPEFKIYVYYGAGKCKRVKIGHKTKTIKEDVYEVQCL